MNQFTRKLSGLTGAQKDSLKTILGRAGRTIIDCGRKIFRTSRALRSGCMRMFPES
jgi:hypothetical protein